MSITTEKIIDVARSWIGTKFQHQGRIKTLSTENESTNSKFTHTIITGGIDCLGLIIGVAKELNLESKTGIPLYRLDNADYAAAIQNDELYKNIFEHLYEISFTELCPADIICFKIQNYIKHVAIFSHKNNIIHITHETEKVVEHLLTEYWEKRACAAFRFKEIMQNNIHHTKKAKL